MFSAKGFYNCDKAMVVTNSRYTDQARELANKNSVILWDRDDLVKNLLKFKEVKTVITEPVKVVSVAPDNCVVCGKNVSEKVKKYCLDNSQRFRGKVYCFNCQKSV